ncbi:MAG: L-lactate permease [Candidatus Tectomicrobia bacterium]|uniref:L-lactate permease n=1 Tax=Tectimicrobiota bacterium TaxID=2528274 RepID=A0A932MQ17_UNCTE|nr:L-lactate permease [Candidatus Tectomicrobia bacterium]
MGSALKFSGLNWLLAFLPILALMLAMLVLRWGGKKAGPFGLAVGLLAAWARFGAGPDVLAVALLRGFLLSIPVLYIIIPALILYHVADAAGGIRNIGWSVSDMTKNHILQLMILAFGFTTFLQGVAGFGVPVAVVAPLLVGIGYPPVEAVAAALIGHAWSVSMGDMASSFQALLSVTRLPPHELGVHIALLLASAGLAAAVSIAHQHAGWSAVRRWPAVVTALAAVATGAQVLLAWLDLWIIASFGAGMLCLLVGFGMARLPRYQGPSRPPSMVPKPEARRVRSVLPPEGARRMSFHLAFAPYYSLIAVVSLVTFVPAFHDALHAWKFRVPIDETITDLGVVTARQMWSIAPFGHPGALLLYTSFLGWAFYRMNGRWPGRQAALFRRTFKDAYPTAVGIVSMVALASVMTASGMVVVLADGAAEATGRLFPLVSPLVGLLGCFVTGSNTNSNILFGAFQVEVGELTGVQPVILAAAQSAGGSLGSMIAPAKVLVGCATAGLSGREAEVFKRVAGYCAVQVLIVGALAWWLAQ